MRKKWTVLLAALLTASSIAGCAGSSGTSESVSGDKTAGPQSEAAQTEGQKSGEKTVLKFACWDYENPGYDRDLIDAFMEMYPEYDVQVFDIPAKEYPTKVAVMLAGDEDIDVFYSKNAQMYNSLITKNQAMDLTDLLKEKNVDMSCYGSVVDDLTVDGKLYGLTYRADSMLLYYNKDLFDQAGVAYPTNDWTWDDYADAAKKIAHGDGDDKVYGGFWETRGNIFWTPAMGEDMGNILDGDYDMFKRTLDMVVDLQDSGAIMDWATNRSLNTNARSFYQGKIGMLHHGSWVLGWLIQDKEAGKHNLNWGVAELPSWPGKGKINRNSYTPVCINSKTKNLEGAWKLLDFLAGKEGAMRMADCGMSPGYLDEDVLKVYSDPKFPEGVAELIRPEDIRMDLPAGPITNAISDMVTEEIELVVTGNKSVDDAIRDMKERREEIRKENQ